MDVRSGTVEGLGVTGPFWTGRRVFLTGHTGFKGGWLSLWLQSMGAEVHGYALEPPTNPSLFQTARVGEGLASHTVGDIRDAQTLQRAMVSARPEVVFHLAAQPLVRQSYREPLETYAVNVIGTANLLEAVRALAGVRAVVVVTSDKCYENREWAWGYRENEPLGGFDPYSSSKACAELVTDAYRRSFLQQAGVEVASVRAGNVLGGGDWAAERLVPDFLRSLDRGEPLRVRSPRAIRPWQHVLEPLSGYLLLAERLCLEGGAFAEPWNFGPPEEDIRSVAWIAGELARSAGARSFIEDAGPLLHEAGCLKLDSSKARDRLGWRTRWRLPTALSRVLEWHRAWCAGADMRAHSLAEIAAYGAAGLTG